MNSKKIIVVCICVFICIIGWLILKNMKKDESKELNYTDVNIVTKVKENSTDVSAVYYEVEDENGDTILTYEQANLTREDDEKALYEIKDKDGKTIGTTENTDDIHLYIENPDYGKYAPSITE